jgi:hypothetical protein
VSLLLGFAPFIAFAAAAGALGSAAALWIAAAISAISILRARRRGASLKLLDAASLALFAGLAVFVTLQRPDLAIVWIRLAVNSGLAAIALGSILLRRPFTLQYAREQVAPEVSAHPLFIAVNYRISAVWTAVFVIQAAATVVPGLAEFARQGISLAALAAAIFFTIEYPKRVRARAAERAAV